MLIAYFSLGGNTRHIAKIIHDKVGGELFEIARAKPYPDEYEQCLKEVNAEKKSGAKIELKALVPPGDMAKHKVVFVGYPNWLQSMPRPVVSFLEAYDWAGKIVMPFCSHGGGRLGQTESEMAKLCQRGKVIRSLAVFKTGGEAVSDLIEEWLGAVEGEDV